MFEVIVNLKNDWIDLSGVSDVELFKALSDWSSGKEQVIKISGLSFQSEEIVQISINR